MKQTKVDQAPGGLALVTCSEKVKILPPLRLKKSQWENPKVYLTDVVQRVQREKKQG